MQEFSSISASTYEPGSLAERLTEKSADGWDVVAIVTTGSTVTAYLSRAAAGGHDQTAGSTTPAEREHVEAASVDTAEPAVAADQAPADGSGWAMETGASAAAVAAAEPAPDLVTPAPEPAPGPAAEPAPEPAPEPAAEPAAAAAGAAAAAAGAAPAGWYADPSSRYELRYWDGSTWTEHVSRAGQQYTDPPVA